MKTIETSRQYIHKLGEPSEVKSDLQFATPSRRILSWVPIVLVTFGIFFLVMALANKQLTSGRNNQQSGVASSTKQAVSVNQVTQKVKVDVEGAVNRPGVYELTNDSRIQDVLISAGGLSAKADRIYVSKYINLSQRLSDGMKIYIPYSGETLATSQIMTDVVKYSVGANSTLGHMININDASQESLERLNGIGPVTAKKIISGRPYQNISELLTKHILTKSIYDKNKDFLSTN